MQILVDADACPVVGIVEKLARERKIPVILLCDTNHVLNSEYSEVRVIGAGADAVDFALVSLCRKGDIVVTLWGKEPMGFISPESGIPRRILI